MTKGSKIGLAIVGAAVLGLGSFAAFSQQSTPSELPGCVYNATPPTLSDKQTVAIQCDANGKIIVH